MSFSRSLLEKDEVSVNDSGRWEEGSVAARFTVSRKQAARAFLNRLAAHDYAPLDLLEPSLLSSARRVYIPYYSFDVEYRADFSVSIGYQEWIPQPIGAPRTKHREAALPGHKARSRRPDATTGPSN